MRRGLEIPSRFHGYELPLDNAITVQPLNVQFEMAGSGWAHLHLNLGESATTIWLSYVYDPFPTLLSWLGAVDRGELPIQMEIDEEGASKHLTLHPTSMPGSAHFIVDEPYSTMSFLNGPVDIGQVMSSFRDALRTFFEGEFIPESWEMSCQKGTGIPWALELETKMLEDPILRLHS